MENVITIASTLRSFAGKKILIAPHMNPDGDAMGSSLGLAHIALYLSCDVKLLYHDGVPDHLRWLTIPCPIVHDLSELGSWKPDLFCTVDCGDKQRVGKELSSLFSKEGATAIGWDTLKTMNIDHHLGNSEFADHNWVDPKIAATGQLIGNLARELGKDLSGDLGEAIYLALVADTGNFSFSNTSRETFEMAGEIVGNGLLVGKFTERLENQWSHSRMLLWGAMTNAIELHADGKIALSCVTQDIMKKYKTTKEDLEGFVSWMLRIKGVKVALFLREDAKSECKMSVRSVGGVDVRSVATAFGGGGHKAAAGGLLLLPIREASQAVLEKLVVLV